MFRGPQSHLSLCKKGPRLILENPEAHSISAMSICCACALVTWTHRPCWASAAWQSRHSWVYGVIWRLWQSPSNTREAGMTRLAHIRTNSCHMTRPGSQASAGRPLGLKAGSSCLKPTSALDSEHAQVQGTLTTNTAQYDLRFWMVSPFWLPS